jgi:hypothetical protein
MNKEKVEEHKTKTKTFLACTLFGCTIKQTIPTNSIAMKE